MAIEQWRPNLRAAPTMPMGPYRRGDQPKYPDYCLLYTSDAADDS